MNLSSCYSRNRVIGAIGILCTAFLAGCSPAAGDLRSPQTTASRSRPTSTATATPTVVNTLARIPTITTTLEPTANRKYYDLMENYSILPPPGWEFKWSYHPNTYWWASSAAELYHERVTWAGTKEAFYAKCKSDLISAPQHKVLFEEDFSTDGGIASHMIVEQYMGKTKMIRIARFVIPVGKDLLVFEYYRYAESSERIDDTVQKSINSVEILVPE
jgi:hypothetical protein